MSGFVSLELVDQDCKMLVGEAAVSTEGVDLGKEEKPFRCEAKAAGKAECRSSRSGKTSAFTVEQQDELTLVLRYAGTGDWAAVIRVDKKTGRFQVASSRRMAGKGLTSELCVGKATVK